MSDNLMNFNKFGDFFKNARRVQEQMEKTQKELSAAEVIGESGGGMVQVLLVGGRTARRVQIDPALFGDREMLQDLVGAAITDALGKSEHMTAEKMRALAGAMHSPEE